MLAGGIALLLKTLDGLFADQLALLIDAHIQPVLLRQSAVGRNDGIGRAARHAEQILGVDTGNALGGRVACRAANDLHGALHADRLTGIEHRDGVFADNAGRLALSVQIDFTAGNTGFGRNAKFLKSRRIGRCQMPADARSDNGVVF